MLELNCNQGSLPAKLHPEEYTKRTNQCLFVTELYVLFLQEAPVWIAAVHII